MPRPPRAPGHERSRRGPAPVLATLALALAGCTSQVPRSQVLEPLPRVEPAVRVTRIEVVLTGPREGLRIEGDGPVRGQVIAASPREVLVELTDAEIPFDLPAPAGPTGRFRSIVVQPPDRIRVITTVGSEAALEPDGEALRLVLRGGDDDLDRRAGLTGDRTALEPLLGPRVAPADARTSAQPAPPTAEGPSIGAPEGSGAEASSPRAQLPREAPGEPTAEPAASGGAIGEAPDPDRSRPTGATSGEVPLFDPTAPPPAAAVEPAAAEGAVPGGEPGADEPTAGESFPTLGGEPSRQEGEVVPLFEPPGSVPDADAAGPHAEESPESPALPAAITPLEAAPRAPEPAPDPGPEPVETPVSTPRDVEPADRPDPEPLPPASWDPDAPVQGPPPDGPAARRLLAIEPGPEPLIRLVADGELTWSLFHLDGPPRIVLDLSGIELAVPRAAREVTIGSDLVSRVRAGQFRPDVARVVVDLAAPARLRVRRDGAELVLSPIPDPQPAGPSGSGNP